MAKTKTTFQISGQRRKVDNAIAILPFLDISLGKENEYFSDGITDQVINALAGIEGMKVASRTSSFAYKGKQVDIREIGKALGVTTILEGSVRRVKNRVRITAQLINVKDGFQFWSETIDRPLDDVFALQDEVSAILTKHIYQSIGLPKRDRHLINPEQVNVYQYKKFLKAKFHTQKMDKASIEKGISILNKVLTKHPDFADAYLELNKAFIQLAIMGVVSIKDITLRVKNNLDKVSQLEPEAPEYYRYLSLYYFCFEWDLAEAHRHLDKALKLNPNYAAAYRTLGLLLCTDKKFDQAHIILDKALELDPIFGYGLYLKAYVYYCQENFPAAIQCCKDNLAIEPDHLFSYTLMTNALTYSGNASKALDLVENLSSEKQQDISIRGSRVIARIYLGEQEKIQEDLNVITNGLDTDYRGKAIISLIHIYAALDDAEQYLRLLNDGISEKLPLVTQLHLEPRLKKMHKNPQVRQLLLKVLKEHTYLQQKKKKQKKSLIREGEEEACYARLQQFMSNEKPYLLQDLNLRKLAEMLDLHPNLLSQLLNEKAEMNFAEFINTYRLETFKIKAQDPNNKRLTILALAYESGFSSKTVFNTFFKKKMKVTPSAYWKKIRK